MNKQIIFLLTVIIFIGLSACNTTNKSDNSEEDTIIIEIDTISIIDEDVIQDNGLVPKIISEYDEEKMISTIFVEYKGKKTQLTKMEGAIIEFDENSAQTMMIDVPETAGQIFYGYYVGLAACFYVMETEVEFIIFEATIWEGEDKQMQIVEEMWRKEK